MEKKMLPRALPAAALLLAALCLAGCVQPAASASGQGSGAGAPASSQTPAWMVPAGGQPGGAVDVSAIGPGNYPRVDGSTAALPLMAEVQSRVCGVPLEEAETTVSASRTSEAWLNLAEGGAELLLVYEAPEETQARLAELDTRLEVTPIGVDALVFLTNTENPVDSLTAAQLRGIYTDTITNWSEVGGADSPITAFQRNPDSGSQALFLKLLMDGVKPADPPSEQISMGMGGLIDQLSAFDGTAAAIGYSVFYYASQMYQNPQLKFLAVEGVAPAAEGLADGSYPFTNAFFVAIRADEPAGSPARLLRDWVLSPEGAAAVAETGYVPWAG